MPYPRGTTKHWYDSTATDYHPSLRTLPHKRSITRASPKLPPELGPSLAVDENGARLQHLPKLRQNLRLQNLQNPSCKPRCYNLSRTSPSFRPDFTPFPLCPSVTLTKLTHVCLRQSFRGQHGKAYLFNAVVNVSQGEATERNMTTGRHIVRDISCWQCKDTVGWKYDKAYEANEKYKEGKYILEAELLVQVF